MQAVQSLATVTALRQRIGVLRDQIAITRVDVALQDLTRSHDHMWTTGVRSRANELMQCREI